MRGAEIDRSDVVGRWGVHVGEWGGVRVEESRRLKGEDGSALQLPHSVTIVFITAAATQCNYSVHYCSCHIA